MFNTTVKIFSQHMFLYFSKVNNNFQKIKTSIAFTLVFGFLAITTHNVDVAEAELADAWRLNNCNNFREKLKVCYKSSILFNIQV